jgi:protein-S-isoprenylcysteine O-methyltransferase Ste14
MLETLRCKQAVFKVHVGCLLCAFAVLGLGDTSALLILNPPAILCYMKNFLVTLAFAFIAVATVILGIPYLISNLGFAWTYEIGGFKFFGVIPIVIGITLWIWSARDFIIYGKGTPAPLYPPKQLVSRRLFRIIRNPMYVAVVLIILGEAVLAESFSLLIYTLLIWSLFHLFVVYYEEPINNKRFGSVYKDYLRDVPRWMPKIKHGR